MATITNTNTSTKVIRIQDDEKELLFRLREIYGNDYKKYGEYIKRESNVPLTIKKIYKLLDERKAYRRISDYFHRERASRKAKEPHSNALYTRSSTRGITQVPEQISLINIDHEMDDDDEIDNDDEDNHTGTGTDNDQQQPSSPTITNGSDELIELNHITNNNNDDDEQQQQQQNRLSSIISSTHQRKRMLPLTNHKRPAPPPTSSIITSTMNGKSDLLSVRAHLEKALRELDHAIVSKDEYNDDEHHRSIPIRNHLLTNGHRHSKLDDIVRSLSNVVNQQQENARLIIDESSVLLIDDVQQKDDIQSVKLSTTTTQESIKKVLERLNALVDRGNSIYDRVESILSEF